MKRRSSGWFVIGSDGRFMSQLSDALVSAHAVVLDRATCEILLQRRDSDSRIGQPGLLGLFGGRMEGQETGRMCIVRELHEELGLRTHEMTILAEWCSDLGPQIVFLVRVDSARPLHAYEGHLERYRYEEAIASADLTRLAARSLAQYQSLIAEVCEM
jgi:8-oxo-dGTP pyrophosphatase MutT (NUDIX family)